MQIPLIGKSNPEVGIIQSWQHSVKETEVLTNAE